MQIRVEMSRSVVATPELDEQGNVRALLITPIFPLKHSIVPVAHCEANNDQGMHVDEFDLLVSGATGKVKKVSKREPAKAWIDMTREEREALSKPEDEEDQQ